MEPTNDNSKLIEEMKQLGFDEAMVKEAVKYTQDKEKIVEVVLRYGEKGLGCDVSDIVKTQTEAPILKNEDSPFKFKMIFVVNCELKMGKGKICAQVGHACLAAYLQMENIARYQNDVKETLECWETFGCAKIVVQGKNEKELLELEKKANQLKINSYLVEDAGRTQVKEGSRTVLALGPVAASIIDPITSHLKLL